MDTDIIKHACTLYNVNYNEYIAWIESCSLNRYLTEQDYGKEKSDNLYSVLSFIDGYAYCKTCKND